MEIKKFMEFIKESPACFQAVENLKEMLEKSNFIELKDNVKLERGKSYYKTRNDSAIIAFRIPNEFSSFRIVSSHSDSPCYKIKANPTYYKNGFTMLNVAKYGGMIHSTFFDKPLTVAGRVSYLDSDNNVASQLISFGKTMAGIVNLPIHFNRTINDGYKYSVAKDMMPIFSLGEVDLLKLIQDKFDIPNEIITHDLFVCSNVDPYIWGINDEFISSPRLDDLECAYASIKAMIEVENPKEIIISTVFNNEEVGSSSYMGADSDFLKVILARIKEDLNLSETFVYNALEKSFAISADNAHALHPNYTESYDMNNFTMINSGIVIKFSPSQKYTTDGITAAKFIALCNKAGKKYQKFENHSNVLGGSTLGNISNSQVSIPSVDIGLPQLAMHSSCETAGVKDFLDLIEILKTHYSN